MNNSIYHYGIKGMKWGVRRYQNKDGSLTTAGKRRYADNYSSQQQKRDEKIYGKGAVKRINKRMLKGESIQSARHNEVIRNQRKDSGKAIAKTTTKAAFIIGGAAAVAKLLQKKGFADSIPTYAVTEQVTSIGRQVINALFK